MSEPLPTQVTINILICDPLSPILLTSEWMNFWRTTVLAMVAEAPLWLPVIPMIMSRSSLWKVGHQEGDDFLPVAEELNPLGLVS